MTEAEQNRLILENVGLCARICADYRSAGTDFEELLAEAHLALCEAARRHVPSPENKFSVFASLCINQALVHLLNREERHRRVGEYDDGFGIIEPVSSETPLRPFEWDAWGDGGNARAICDWFNSIAVMPGDVECAHDRIRNRRERFASATIGLKPIEKKLIEAHLAGVSYEDISRLNHMSYRIVVRRLEKIFRIMRQSIEGQDRAARSRPRAKSAA